MKHFIIAMASASLLLTAFPPVSEAASKNYRKSGKSYLGGPRIRGFSQRDIDRLPVRVTRPPNTGHYIYKDYPYWAARAFQPALDR
jgi:hypothetical protein